MSQRIRILIVDDHSMVRKGMAGLLAMESDLEVVSEAEDMDHAVAEFERHQPDITLMDVRMPGGSGLDALVRLRRISARARVVILSSYDLEAPILAAHAAGAAGYLLKSVSDVDLVSAIRRVHAGGHCFPAALQDYIAASTQTKSLSRREIETLNLIRRGLSNKDIGRVLGITDHTVKFHVKGILEKLEVADRAEAVGTAYDRGLLQVE